MDYCHLVNYGTVILPLQMVLGMEKETKVAEKVVEIIGLDQLQHRLARLKARRRWT